MFRRSVVQVSSGSRRAKHGPPTLQTLDSPTHSTEPSPAQLQLPMLSKLRQATVEIDVSKLQQLSETAWHCIQECTWPLRESFNRLYSEPKLTDQTQARSLVKSRTHVAGCQQG